MEPTRIIHVLDVYGAGVGTGTPGVGGGTEEWGTGWRPRTYETGARK